MHEIIWDFDIQIDHPILARKSDLVLIKKKELVIKWILPYQQTTVKKMKEG